MLRQVLSRFRVPLAAGPLRWMDGAAGHQRCWLLGCEKRNVGQLCRRLKSGQLVCEVQAERSAFMANYPRDRDIPLLYKPKCMFPGTEELNPQDVNV